MDHFREIRNSLVWHKEGKFEVELINGVITKLNFCEPGKGVEDTGRCLTSTSFKFLQSVHSCLGDLFTFIEEENKRLGYKYSREEEVQPYHHDDEPMDGTYGLATETKLRPLINYTNQQNENEALDENDGLNAIGKAM